MISRGPGGTNGSFATVVTGLVVLSPLPLGSHRPAFWALGALVLSFVSLLYLLKIHRGKIEVRLDLHAMRPLFWLAGLYFAYVVVQALPVGWITGPFDVVVPQGVFLLNSLSTSPADTVLAAIRQAGHAMLFLLILQLSFNRVRARKMAWFLFAAAVAWALFALVSLTFLDDTILLFEKWAYIGSATGPFVNRNSFAFYLAMGLILGTGLIAGELTGPAHREAAFLDNGAFVRAIAVIGAVIIAVTLVQTQSRMGLFAGLCGAALTLGLVLRKRLHLSRALWLRAIGLGVFLVGVIVFLYGEAVIERFFLIDEAAAIRLALYSQILDMIAAKPLSGWGADAFYRAFTAFRTDPVNSEFTWELAHSTYLAHWVETGIVIGSIPLILTATAFWICLTRALRREKDIVLPAIGAGVVLAGALHSLVDFSLEIQANVWTFVTILGLALAARKSSRKAKA